MRKTVLLSMIMGLMLSAQSVVAQVPTIQWQKSLGGSNQDIAYNIQLTTDGGYIVAGGTSSIDGDVTGQHGLSDFWVVKLDSQGGVLWQKTLGGSGEDIARSIQQTNDGGYIVAGYTYSTNGDITGNNGQSDYWVVKLNTLGEMQWQKSMGGSSGDAASSIHSTVDGGYIVGGYAFSNNGDVTGNQGNADYWVLKLDSQGVILWQKTLGGTNQDAAYSIQPTSEGGYVLTGYTNSTNGDVFGNQGSLDYWVVKLNSQGDLQWQKTLGGTADDFGYSIMPTADSGYIVAGNSNSNNGDVTGNQGNSDIWIVKLSPDALQISEFESNLVSISPNPASTYINIQLKNITELNGGTINIINSLGQVIITTPIKITEMSNSIQLNTLGSKGIYFVQIINSKGQLINVKKIILQ